MPPRRGRLNSGHGRRSYRKLFVVVAEGVKAEPQFFYRINDQESVIHVKCPEGGNDRSPPQVLKRMKPGSSWTKIRGLNDSWPCFMVGRKRAKIRASLSPYLSSEIMLFGAGYPRADLR